MKNRTEENGSKNNEWETPEYVFDELNKDSRFNMDLCATDKNKKCLDWTDDALNYIPHKLGLDIWCNPPYSFPLKDKIIRKCYELSQMKGVNSVTMLIPSSTETRVFHDIIWKYALRIEFIDTRVRFKGYNTKGEYVTNATGQSGSMIVTFIKRHELSSDRPYVLTRKFEYREVSKEE